MGMTRILMGPKIGSPSTGWASRRKTAIREATVSALGERRSWGRVSQASRVATSCGSPPYQDLTAWPISWASCSEGTTMMMGP